MTSPYSQTPTDKLLSPSMLSRLSDTEENRRPIPREDLQAALGEIGVVADHDLPAAGETATLKFADGTKREMKVTGYSKTAAQVEVPVGDEVAKSNVDLGAFEALTRDTRNK